MDSNPQVGIASPKLLNPDHTIQPQGGALPGLFKIILWAFLIDDLPLLDRLILPYHQNYPQFFTQTRPLGWVAGTAMCLRRSLLDEIGLLDEKIFMYSEDTDLCLRAQSHGHSVYNVSSSQVIHLGHASGSNTQAILGEFRGLIYLYRKHYPAWQLPLLRLILKFAVLLRLFLFGTIFRQPHKYDTYQKALKIS
jgi:GT2 family glycosyltransferase